MVIAVVMLPVVGAAAVCPRGDLNGDCIVDIRDLIIVADNWLDPDCTDPACGDLDVDQRVSMNDVAVMAAAWQDAASPLAITEFMASNGATLADEDGDFSDWIEIRNVSNLPVDLQGWYLTDHAGNPRQWALPEMPLGGGEDLLVFASGKDRSDPAGQLHANFSLDMAGEYLALSNPARGVAHEWADGFPPQLPDVSYGLVENAAAARLIREGDSVRYYVPSDDTLGDEWRDPAFDDASWSSGRTPAGYEEGSQPRAWANLVAYWSFDDGAEDHSGNDNHAVISGADFSDDIPPAITSGKSISFDGLSDYIRVPDSPTLDLATGAGQPFTVAYWFKTTDSQAKVVMEKGSKTHMVTRMEAFADSGKISFRMQEDIENQVTSIEPVNDGQWRHFLASFDGQTLGLYIDGVLNAQAAETGYPDNDDPLVIGSRFGAAPWNGMMDDLAIWSCALSEEQIGGLSDGSLRPLDIGEIAPAADQRLAAYWDFNSTVDDISERNHNASNHGAVFSTETPSAIGQGMSLRFNGSNTYLTVPDAPDLRIASKFTLSLWIKSADLGQTHTYLLSRHGAGHQQAVIYEYVDNHVEFFAPSAAGQDPRPGSQMPAADAEWRHVAYTYDGSLWSGYVDGTCIFSVQRSFVLNTGEYPWYVGCADGTAGFFDGWIDDVSIWTEALSEGEVAALAAGTSPRAITGYASLIKTDFKPAMHAGNASIYMRHRFDVTDPATFEDLRLRVKYDDGFIAYLNGVEAARRNAPPSAAWNATAAAEHSDARAVLFEDIDISSLLPVLRSGENVLSVHGLNRAADDDDFLWSCELVAAQPWESSQMYRYFSKPTPGAPNGDGANDIGPVIRDVQHAPGVPSTNDDIVVTAAVTESFFPLDSVRLIYRVMYGPQVSLPMRDDGAPPDRVAGDGIFTAAIPATAHAPGEMVRWFIRAADIRQNPSRWPLFNDPAGSPEYLGAVIDDPALVSNIPVFHWFLEPGTEQAARTRAGTRCALYYDGRLYDNIFVRLRGATAAGLAKNPYKFEFNKGYDFVYSPDHPPVDEFDLNTTYRDKAYVRPILGYELYRDAGVPSSNVMPVHMRRNNAFFSVAIFTEHPDKTFLERNGLDPEGTTYKANLNGFTPEAQGGYLDMSAGFEKKTPKDNDNSDIVAFVSGLAQTGPVRTNFVFDNVDVPAMVNYLAASVLIQDADRLVTNFFAYRDTHGTGEWTMLPWDLDLSLGQAVNSSDQMYADQDYPNGPSHPFYGAQNFPDWRNPHLWNKMVDVFSSTPRLRQMFLRRLRTLMDTFLMPAGTPRAERYFEPRIDELHDLMAADVLLDQAKWSSWGQAQTFRQALDRIENDYLAPRRTHLYVNHRADDVLQTEPQVLVTENAAKTVIVPTAEVPEGWNSDVDFDDSAWLSGAGGVGYEVSSGYHAYFDVDVEQHMYAKSGSCFIRIPFAVPQDPATFTRLTLKIRYDDGFIAYINGNAVAAANQPADPRWNSQATGGHSDNYAVVFSEYDISAFIHTLRQGSNLLAVHGLNYPIDSSDFLISVELIEGENLPSNPTAVGIPAAQTTGPDVSFGAIEYNPASGNQDEEYIELINNGNTAVDMSGWQISDGVDYTFKPGVVLPAGGSLYVSPNVRAFRARPAGPSGSQGLFVQGNFKGHLSNWGESLHLLDQNANLVASAAYPADPTPQQAYLRITELMYHPRKGGNYNEEEYEYIELKNIGDAPLPLAGVKFTDGITYTFADGPALPPAGLIVLAKNPDAFASRYTVPDGVEVLGPYEGNLSNSGENIKLEDVSNSTILEFAYDDDWCPTTDGDGYSLTIVNPESILLDGWGNPSFWQPSTLAGGTPGCADTSVTR